MRELVTGREPGALIPDAIELFLTHRRMRGVSTASLSLYRRWLCFWAEWRRKRDQSMQIPEVSIEQLRAFFCYLMEEHVPHQDNTHRPSAQNAASPPRRWRAAGASCALSGGSFTRKAC